MVGELQNTFNSKPIKVLMSCLNLIGKGSFRRNLQLVAERKEGRKEENRLANKSQQSGPSTFSLSSQKSIESNKLFTLCQGEVSLANHGLFQNFFQLGPNKQVK